MSYSGVSDLPMVAVPADVFFRGHHRFHGVGEKYIGAAFEGSGVLPVLLPALGAGVFVDDHASDTDFNALVRRFDGILLTGSASNVAPALYDAGLEDNCSLRDHQRDATTLPIVRAAIEQGVPLFAICRGFQEVNVACGGTLHQDVQDVPGFLDHREDESAPFEHHYNAAHEITITENGMLHELYGDTRAEVNSLHGQGLDRLGQGVVVEAVAPDGLVEAISVSHAGSFALAVQWHPEWGHARNRLSTVIFEAFGRAVRRRAAARSGRAAGENAA